MGALLALIFVVSLFALMICGLIAEQRKRAAQTEEEWEHRERQTSVLSAGVMAVEQSFRPHLKDIAVVQMDAEEGRMPGVQHEHNRRPKESSEPQN